jgi:hypothetical protein
MKKNEVVTPSASSTKPHRRADSSVATHAVWSLAPDRKRGKFQQGPEIVRENGW